MLISLFIIHIINFFYYFLFFTIFLTQNNIYKKIKKMMKYV